jgi:hypothetical protein
VSFGQTLKITLQPPNSQTEIYMRVIFKNTLFNLQGHVFFLRGHKVCKEHAILMPVLWLR